MSSGGDDTLRDLLDEAARLKEQGQLDEAITTLKRAIDINIDDAEAYLQLGLVYFERLDYAQAAKALTVAAALQPTKGLIHYHLGLAYHALGDENGVRSIQGALIIIDRDLLRMFNDQIAQR
jgi:tetratricopeptide (TPR) repeat protein